MTGHRFRPEKAGKLLDPKRKNIVSPEQVMDILEIKLGDIVADLGAGNGYFTVPIAQQTKELVYAIDVQSEMLELLKEHAEKEEVTGIEYILSDISNTSLRDHSVDKVLIAFVIHEVPNFDEVLQEVKRIVKPGGKLLILEWAVVESEMGPPLHERIASKDLQNQVRSKGFQSTVFQLHETIYGLLVTL